MNIDIRILAIVAVIIALIAGVFLCSGKGDKNEGIEDVVGKAQELLDSTNAGEMSENTGAEGEENSTRRLYTTTGEINTTPDTPTEGSPITDLVSSQDTVFESGEQNNELRSESVVDTSSSVSSVQNEPGKDDNSKNNDELISAEKRELENFYNDIVEWDNPNNTASEARSKAAELRASAQQVRESAATADPSVRDAMLNRAQIIEEYAGRISATRSNSAKLRALERDAKKELGK